MNTRIYSRLTHSLLPAFYILLALIVRLGGWVNVEAADARLPQETVSAYVSHDLAPVTFTDTEHLGKVILPTAENTENESQDEARFVAVLPEPFLFYPDIAEKSPGIRAGPPPHTTSTPLYIRYHCWKTACC